MTITQLKEKFIRGTALFVSLLMIDASGPLALLAQQPQSDAQANPQFQGQIQNPSTPSGGPVNQGQGTSAQPQPQPDAQTPSPAPAPSYSEQPPEAPSSDDESDQQPAQPRSKSRRKSTNLSPLETRITLRAHEVPLATFLDIISAQAQINFILSEGLEACKVTAFLQNVTVRDALQVLLEIKGLTYRRVGETNTYLVTARTQTATPVVTRIYTLSYIPLINIGTASQLQTSLAPSSSVGSPVAMSGGGSSGSGGSGSGGGGSQSDSSGGGGGGMGNAGSSSQGGQGGGANTPAIISVVQSVLTRQGHVVADSRTNSLIITDIPDVFPQIEQIIAELDRKAPQIMIEAQIVEIDSDKANDLGIEWGGPDGQLASFTGGERDTSFPMQLPNNLSLTRFLDPVTNIISSLGTSAASSLGASGSSGSGTTINTGTSNSAAANVPLTGSAIQTSILNLTSLTVILRALVSTSQARFLGKPKILTLNNQPALIQIETNQATSVTSNIASGGSSGVSVTGASIERTETGLIMSVTPQVNKDGYITMLVRPSFTNVQQSALSSGSNPVFDAVDRAATSLVRVKNGQTLVLGGLLESNETKTVRKVPLLGYIPIIGWLFTSTQSEKSNTDLVIFLTPTIISD
jgi:type II secretory pathway component GspD/PulD (secretin)